MSEPWAIYIDEEGFAEHWNDTMAAFQGLNALMEAICRIGMNVYPNKVERLFCHQFGDGFLITSDFHETNLSRAVLITIAILRHILSFDRIARATLAEGEVADVIGCYPKEVRDAPDHSCVRLGSGLLTTSPVLGEGLLRTVGLGKKSPRGPLLLVDSILESRLPNDVVATKTQASSISLNWLKGEPRGLQEIQQRANLAIEGEPLRLNRVSQYIDRHVKLNDEWKAGVHSYLIV
jgi:hypothetical protein